MQTPTTTTTTATYSTPNSHNTSGCFMLPRSGRRTSDGITSIRSNSTITALPPTKGSSTRKEPPVAQEPTKTALSGGIAVSMPTPYATTTTSWEIKKDSTRERSTSSTQPVSAKNHMNAQPQQNSARVPLFTLSQNANNNSSNDNTNSATASASNCNNNNNTNGRTRNKIFMTDVDVGLLDLSLAGVENSNNNNNNTGKFTTPIGRNNNLNLLSRVSTPSGRSLSSNRSMTAKSPAECTIENTRCPNFEYEENTGFPNEAVACDHILRKTYDIVKDVIAQKDEAILKNFKSIFLSEQTQEFIQDSFWWFFVDSYTDTANSSPQHQERNKDALFSRMASSYVQIFMNLKPSIKDRVLAFYPDAIAQSVYRAYFYCFPQNRMLFNRTFKKIILKQIHYWITGLELRDDAIDLSHWSRLEQEEKRTKKKSKKPPLSPKRALSSRAKRARARANWRRAFNAVRAFIRVRKKQDRFLQKEIESLERDFYQLDFASFEKEKLLRKQLLNTRFDEREMLEKTRQEELMKKEMDDDDDEDVIEEGVLLGTVAQSAVTSGGTLSNTAGSVVTSRTNTARNTKKSLHHLFYMRSMQSRKSKWYENQHKIRDITPTSTFFRSFHMTGNSPLMSRFLGTHEKEKILHPGTSRAEILAASMRKLPRSAAARFSSSVVGTGGLLFSPANASAAVATHEGAQSGAHTNRCAGVSPVNGVPGNLAFSGNAPKRVGSAPPVRRHDTSQNNNNQHLNTTIHAAVTTPNSFAAADAVISNTSNFQRSLSQLSYTSTVSDNQNSQQQQQQQLRPKTAASTFGPTLGAELRHLANRTTSRASDGSSSRRPPAGAPARRSSVV